MPGHYNYFRDYDPTLGRYVESDPIGLLGISTNTYDYVMLDPVVGRDPLGLWGVFGQAGLGAGAHVGMMGLNFNCGVAGSIGSAIGQGCRYCTVCVRIGPGLFGGLGGLLGGGFHKGNAENLSGWSYGVGFDVAAGEGIGGSGGMGFDGEPGNIGDFAGVGGAKGRGGIGFGISVGLEACRTEAVCTKPLCQSGAH